ncbi:MAG: hypothetical protein HYR60_05290 [Acidobacteria bacterium]|nr:hypothetical protein [Acidobacteriota bacterium]
MDLLMLAAGLAASFAVVAANLALARFSGGLDVLGWIFLGFLPVGAAIGGWLAAGGVYLGARAVHRLPEKTWLVSMLLAAGWAWVLYHWLGYYSGSLADGTRLRDHQSFWEFFRNSTERMYLLLESEGSAPPAIGPLGKFGYLIPPLRLFGFLVGGKVFHWFLDEHPEVCRVCRRYPWKRTVLKPAPPARFAEIMRRAGLRFDRKDSKAPYVTVGLALYSCRRCRRKWLTTVTSIYDLRMRGESLDVTDAEIAHLLEAVRATWPALNGVAAPSQAELDGRDPFLVSPASQEILEKRVPVPRRSPVVPLGWALVLTGLPFWLCAVWRDAATKLQACAVIAGVLAIPVLLLLKSAWRRSRLLPTGQLVKGIAECSHREHLPEEYVRGPQPDDEIGAGVTLEYAFQAPTGGPLIRGSFTHFVYPRDQKEFTRWPEAGARFPIAILYFGPRDYRIL